ncbi:hypothetical protein AKO1_005608 [Acrasis kona]|uniref:Late embryogenesis abundant protein LEA-2 subgroup domain-containing protein n=1 Tax=Acrasis kona TaxID=1008807 RepID=A0AAW2YJG6_9EUKA
MADTYQQPHTTVEVIEVPKKRKLYARRCCIPFILCCIATCILIAIGVGLTVFFLYPRIPDLSITYKSAELKSVNANTLSLSITINLNITVDNKNYVTLQADQVVANVTLKNVGAKIGQAKNQGVISFPSMTKTSQIAPLLFVSTITDQDVFLSVAEQCSASGARSVPLSLQGTYNVYYKGISFAYPMTFSQDADVPCCFGSGC